MPKTFVQNAEENSAFLSPMTLSTGEDRKGQRDQTQPLRTARIIEVGRIQPDPNQPRKTFNQESIESLAESITELGGIIDPITVEFIEKDDCFRIISGERRFRAAKLVSLVEVPCIVKEVDDKNRFLMQLIANLQHEDIQPLEEAAGIKHLMEDCAFNQSKVARLLNKSKSYISQVLGLERLGEEARAIIRNSSIAKDAQIQASRETDPTKQQDILVEASKDGNTIRKLRKDRISNKHRRQGSDSDRKKTEDSTPKEEKVFREWLWMSPDNSVSISIKFTKNQDTTNKTTICKNVLKMALENLDESANSPSPL